MNFLLVEYKATNPIKRLARPMIIKYTKHSPIVYYSIENSLKTSSLLLILVSETMVSKFENSFSVAPAKAHLIKEIYPIHAEPVGRESLLIKTPA